ncbi:MAG: thioredoxin-disulfide reductase [Candidatus Marinimicrobia bacterium]|nr:thioredoxin-disulfide reductase [Candidatus Neomarinimicrobiota bacterium]|tara:strand:- start:15634 stop:16563 length:930 start_codon:yes stop_codon:yes gene_type:complete
MKRKVIIIGTGPAGFTAALYAGRANMEPLIFEGPQPGGQLTITTDVENYPGFPDGVMGPELMELFREQAKRFGTETLTQMVDKVDLSQRPFKVYSGDKEYIGDSIIISTGASAKLLGLESEKRLMGYGVSACATCDAFFFKDKKVFVIGGGDSAMEEATFLTKFASSVTIVHRRDSFRASKIMQDRALSNDKIDVIWNSEVVDLIGDEKDKGLEKVILNNVLTNEKTEHYVDGLFLGIGHSPNSVLFKDYLDLDEKGYIITKPDSSETSLEGVFAAGDIQDTKYMQAITAAGSGCMAAMDAERYLEELE